MFSIRYMIIALAFTVCALAFLKGGPAERGGALLIAANWVAITVTQIVVGSETVSSRVVGLPSLIYDSLLAVGFLWLALRYSSLWLGAAMILQGVQLAIYASFLGSSEIKLRTYAVALNVVSILVLLTILGGTISSWIQRRTARAGSAKLDPA